MPQSNDAVHPPTVARQPIVSRTFAIRLPRAGLLTGVLDGLFACVLSFAYQSTPARMFQGIAAVVLGREAFSRGAATVALGAVMHFGVAFWWSAVFLFLLSRWAWLGRVVTSPYGVVKTASVYGPLIWMVMSLIVIPSFLHRQPPFGIRWWIQLIGHIPFVGVPIVASSAGAAFSPRPPPRDGEAHRTGHRKDT